MQLELYLLLLGLDWLLCRLSLCCHPAVERQNSPSGLFFNLARRCHLSYCSCLQWFWCWIVLPVQFAVGFCCSCCFSISCIDRSSSSPCEFNLPSALIIGTKNNFSLSFTFSLSQEYSVVLQAWRIMKIVKGEKLIIIRLENKIGKQMERQQNFSTKRN